MIKSLIFLLGAVSVAAKWDHMMSMSCDNQLSFLGENDKMKMVWEIPSTFTDVFNLYRTTGEKIIQKLCPTAKPADIKKALPSSIGFFIRMFDKDVVDKKYGKYLQKLGCPFGDVKMDLHDDALDFGMAMPKTCNYARWEKEGKCDFAVELNTDTKMLVSLGECASGMPTGTMRCSGAGCATVLKPCTEDNQCGTNGKCTHLASDAGMAKGMTEALKEMNIIKDKANYGIAALNKAANRVFEWFFPGQFGSIQFANSTGFFNFGLCNVPKNFDNPEKIFVMTGRKINHYHDTPLCGRYCNGKIRNESTGSTRYFAGYYGEDKAPLANGTYPETTCSEEYPKACKSQIPHAKTQTLTIPIMKESTTEVKPPAKYNFPVKSGVNMGMDCQAHMMMNTEVIQMRGKFPFDTFFAGAKNWLIDVLSDRGIKTISDDDLFANFWPASLSFWSAMLDKGPEAAKFDKFDPLSYMYKLLWDTDAKNKPIMKGLPETCNMNSMSKKKCAFKMGADKLFKSTTGDISATMVTCANGLPSMQFAVTGAMAAKAKNAITGSCKYSKENDKGTCTNGEQCLDLGNDQPMVDFIARESQVTCQTSNDCQGFPIEDNRKACCFDGRCESTYNACDSPNRDQNERSIRNNPYTKAGNANNRFLVNMMLKGLKLKAPAADHDGVCVNVMDINTEAFDMDSNNTANNVVIVKKGTDNKTTVTLQFMSDQTLPPTIPPTIPPTLPPTKPTARPTLSPLANGKTHSPTPPTTKPTMRPTYESTDEASTGALVAPSLMLVSVLFCLF